MLWGTESAGPGQSVGANGADSSCLLADAGATVDRASLAAMIANANAGNEFLHGCYSSSCMHPSGKGPASGTYRRNFAETVDVMSSI